ncbi:MAG: putative beta-lysine N-acetyltransferase [Cyclobacteriaceae bacterium]
MQSRDMMMFDKTEKIGKSIVQHGPNNDRAYLMKLHNNDVGNIVEQLYNLTILKRYSKIFAKVPELALDTFKENNFKVEASIPKLYAGKETGYFLAQYFSSYRSYISRKQKKLIKRIVAESSEPYDESGLELPARYNIRPLGPEDAGLLASLYKKVFQVYPFPIFNEEYLLSTMATHVSYFGVFRGSELVAASSAEMDYDQKNAELTDFATHPDHRGKKLAFFLLRKMESYMSAKGVKTLYTIARSVSPGMNKTFGRCGYQFGGTLVNNTLIGESIESMNIWYKHLMLPEATE